MTTLTFTRPAVMGNRVFDQFFDDWKTIVKQSTSGYPVTDIFKDDAGNQIIEMALAGFKKEDLRIEIKENKITIESQTKNKPEGNRRIARRSFSKTFVDYHNQLSLENTKARYSDGLLIIEIPPLKDTSVKVIQIE